MFFAKCFVFCNFFFKFVHFNISFCFLDLNIFWILKKWVHFLFIKVSTCWKFGFCFFVLEFFVISRNYFVSILQIPPQIKTFVFFGVHQKLRAALDFKHERIVVNIWKISDLTVNFFAGQVCLEASQKLVLLFCLLDSDELAPVLRRLKEEITETQSSVVIPE